MVSALVLLSLLAADEPASIPIWKITPPLSDAKPGANYHEEWEIPGQVLTGVTDPAIQVYLPEPAVNTGVAVVICPGGGYRNLWIAKEGWTIARELQKRGIAGIVLKYRHYQRYAAIHDAHRAVRYVRSRAAEWRINPNTVGIGGFSAGGHLALNMAAMLGRPEDWARDEIDALPKRPDFLMLVYPWVQLDSSGVVDASFPPSFFAVGGEDTRTPADSMLHFFNRLRIQKVPAEAHVFEKGGHGFGAGTPDCMCGNWLDLFRNWLQARGYIKR
jgi:acetyl esterase/lipase